MFWFIGSIAIVDLRVMGLAARKRNVGELAEQLFPWAWIGFTLAVISGFLMFATDAGDWAPVQGVPRQVDADRGVGDVRDYRSARRAEVGAGSVKYPTAAKIIALISLLLWIVTILSASEIPALEGLG